MSLQRKVTLLMALSLVLMLAVGTPTSVEKVQAADGTNGYVEIMSNTVADGQPLTLRAYGLDASSDYTLDFTAGCADQYNFSTAANQDEHYLTVIISTPTSGDVCTITLEQQSTGTAIDTDYVNFVTVETLIPTDLLIGLAIVMMVIGIMVGIAASVKVKGKRG